MNPVTIDDLGRFSRRTVELALLYASEVLADEYGGTEEEVLHKLLKCAKDELLAEDDTPALDNFEPIDINAPASQTRCAYAPRPDSGQAPFEPRDFHQEACDGFMDGCERQGRMVEEVLGTEKGEEA